MNACGILSFFNLSKHKLNIYKTKHIEIISILTGVEQTLKKNQPELNSLMCIDSAYAYERILYRNIKTTRVPNFQIIPGYINIGCSQSYQNYFTNTINIDQFMF